MIEISLSIEQRLNLHSLLGAQQVGSDDLRMIWRIQDMIKLTPKEEESIDLKTVVVNDTLRKQWNTEAERVIPPKPYTFSDGYALKIKMALRTMKFSPGPDREWLADIMDVFLPPKAEELERLEEGETGNVKSIKKGKR